MRKRKLSWCCPARVTYDPEQISKRFVLPQFCEGVAEFADFCFEPSKLHIVFVCHNFDLLFLVGTFLFLDPYRIRFALRLGIALSGLRIEYRLFGWTINNASDHGSPLAIYRAT